MARQAWRRISIGGAVLGLAAAGPLAGAVLRVPAEHPSIKIAVSRAADGDTVLVGDGVYLESGIALDKSLTIRSENLFGAVIYGSQDRGTAAFIVRAAVRIEGFVIKGGAAGIKQRGSPDVRWEAANLAVLDCAAGVVIDDVEGNVGSALIRNVAVLGAGDRMGSGFVTNDAGTMMVSDCLVANCRVAFSGYDHLAFRVTGTVALDCLASVEEGAAHRSIPPAGSRIDVGKDFREWRSASLREPRRRSEFRTFLRTALFPRGSGGYGSPRDDAARDAIIALTLAKAENAAGDGEAAARSFDAALVSGVKAGSPEFVWQALIGKAGLERAAETPAGRIALYRRALDHLEDWIPEVPTGIHRIDFLRDKTPAYQALIGLLVAAQAADPSGGHGEEAFSCAEKYRSLGRQDRSRASHGSGAPGRPADPGRSESEDRIAGIQLRLQNPSLTAPEKADLIDSLAAAEDDYEARLIGEERARPQRGPGSMGFPDSIPSPLDFAALKDRLGDRVLLSYFIGESASYSFLATREGLECARLPPGGEIAGLVERYLRFLQLGGSGGFRGATAGRIIFDVLLGQHAAGLSDRPRRIVIVPDGCLYYVPFEALVTGHDGGDGAWHFWGESAVVSYASSAAQAFAEPRPGPRDGGAERVLAVGNSGAIRCDNRFPNRKEFFAPLGRVRDEIKSVVAAFPEGRVTTLLGSRAGEAEFKSADIARYDIIHLAAHGVIDDTLWWRSALLLGPDKKRKEDGFLTALEVAGLEVRARLVVLSACGTGMGRLLIGEGIEGLSGAFLAAGAEDVVVSLWSVDDRATAALMGRFYGLLAAGSPAARALSEAKRWMILRGYRNPFFWAPFVLIGRAEER